MQAGLHFASFARLLVPVADEYSIVKRIIAAKSDCDHGLWDYFLGRPFSRRGLADLFPGKING